METEGREIPIRSMLDILEDDAEPDWIVEGVLMRGAISFLTGESGSFKTFLALDLANRLTHPRSDRWLNHIIDRGSREQFKDEAELLQAFDAANRQLGSYEYAQFEESVWTDSGAFRVMYVMGESAASARHRQEAWMQMTGIETSPHFWLVPQAINLATELEQLVTAWEEGAQDILDVVIVDTFSANTPGVDENSKQSLDPTLQTLRRLKERNKAVLVLHHGTKDGKNSYRGHSSIENDTDIRFVAERNGHDEVISLRSDRQKEFEDWMPYQVRVPVVSLVDDEGRPRQRRSGALLTSRAIEGVFVPPTRKDDVIAYLQENPDSSIGEIAEALPDVEYHGIRDRLHKLLDAGAVVRDKTRNPHRWRYVEVEEV